MADTRADAPWLAYLAPMIAFGIGTTAEGYVPATFYPWAYTIKITAVALAFVIWRTPLRDLRAGSPNVLMSTVVGMVVFAMWVGVEEWLPYPHFGERLGFDPHTIQSEGGRLSFLAVRLTGLILIVPLMEELFWRSLAWRYVIDQDDFRRVPIGTFSATALAVTAGLFALTHSEWLVAAATSAVYGLWMVHTRSVMAAVIAHAVTNAALGIYILRTASWQYW